MWRSCIPTIMLNKRICSSLALLLLLMVGFSACMTKKKLARLKEEYQIFRTNMDSLGTVEKWEERKIREGDRLFISIKTESLNTEQLTVFENGKDQEYLVNSKGYILMPYLDSISVVGKTRMQIVDTIKIKISRFIKNPFVAIRPLDIHVKILGQIEKQGLLVMPENDATVINAIAQAGGVNQFAKRDSILIIRELNGERKLLVVDLRDGRGVFNSDAYRLQNNDLLIVPSNKIYYKQLRNVETNVGLGALTPISTVLGILFITIPLINFLRL